MDTDSADPGLPGMLCSAAHQISQFVGAMMLCMCERIRYGSATAFIFFISVYDNVYTVIQAACYMLQLAKHTEMLL